MEGIVILVVIAAVVGSVGARLAGRDGVGCLGSIVAGLVGALLGRYIAHAADLPLFWQITVAGEKYPVVWAVVGAAIFVGVLGIFSGGKR